MRTPEGRRGCDTWRSLNDAQKPNVGGKEGVRTKVVVASAIEIVNVGVPSPIDTTARPRQKGAHPTRSEGVCDMTPLSPV